MTAPSVPGPETTALLDRLPDPVAIVHRADGLVFGNRAFMDRAPAGRLAEIVEALRTAAAQVGPDGSAPEVETMAAGPSADSAIAWRLARLDDGGDLYLASGREVPAAAGRLPGIHADAFATVAAHDLKEPLRKIGAFSDLLGRSLAAGRSEDAAHAAGVIRDAVQRANALVGNLLALARTGGEALEQRPLDFGALVADVVADVRAGRPETPVTIRTAFDDIAVTADDLQVRQLVQNLVANAIEHRHPDRDPEISLRLRRAPDGRSVVFEVEDNGAGFDPADRQIIFEPFRRLRTAQGRRGSGLGLSIVAAICRRHGWSIEAVGRPGRGALFLIRIPEPAGT